MLLVVALSLVLVTVGAAKPPQVVSIYVGPQTRDGFVDADKGILDSIADIQKELRKTSGFNVVANESMAAVSLYVVSRGTGPAAGGSSINISGAITTYPNGQTVQMPGTSFYIPANSRHVETLLRAGSYERAFVAEDHTYQTWKRCAQMIAKDLATWLAANRERINSGTPPTPTK